MAEVFLAVEQGEHSLDRLVVIKRILPHLAENTEFVEMFMREARIAAGINHPNVVQIYELGSSGGFPFMAMEYVAGSSLKELIRAAHSTDVRIPTSAALHLMQQACKGAHAAHELKDASGHPSELVHRDLSPHNLMVTDEGHVKLLDFGIAKASEGMDTTRTGMLKGKVSYMSPEQCRQERLDRRSDLFALGIVGWELLAGKKPFRGRSELGIMQAIVSGDCLHLRDVRPDVPEPIAAVLHRAMATDPDARFSTADELRRELREAARLGGVEVDADRTALLVRTLLGDSHERRRRQVEGALEKTLLSLSQVGALEGEADTRIYTEDSEIHAPDDPSTTRTGVTLGGAGIVAGAGVLVALGGMGLLGAAAGAWLFWGRAPAEPELVLTGDPIHVTLAPTLEGHVLLAEHEPIRLYLERSTGRPLVFHVAETYDDAARQLVEGEVPFAYLPWGITERTRAEHDHLDILATKVVDGSSGTDGYLVVRRDLEAASVSDLKGETVCYPGTSSQTGYVLPRRYLVEQGLDPDRDFGAHISGNHEQVLRDLLAGVCSIGGTFSVNYSTADQRDIPTAQLRILALTGQTPHDAMVAGRTADPALVDTIREALVAFDPEEHAGVSRVGASERITGFRAFAGDP